MKTILNFHRATGGNVAVLFGLALMPLMLATGAAVDYSRAGEMHSRLQAAADSAVLALCQAPTTTSVADLKSRAENTIRAFVGDGAATVDTPTVTNSPRAVTVSAHQTYTTAFMKVVRQDTVAIGVTASCSASQNFFEIALVLDTTGSMSKTDASGKTKMSAAKDAATAFVQYMFTTGAQPGHVRMSLVPFAASVAIPTSLRAASWVDTTGLSPIHWQSVTGNTGTDAFASRIGIFDKLKATNATWDWKGCVESPPYPHNVSDGAVSTGTPESLIVPLFAPDEQPKTCRIFGISFPCAPNNSYLDDGTGTGTSSTCRKDDPSDAKKFTQACKYKTPTTPVVTAPGPNWHCSSKPFSQLGTAQATIESEISALAAEGQTNIHEGLMWGWRTISPTSIFAGTSGAPIAYDTPNYTKIIVLMTDGMNTWNAESGQYQKSEYSAYGYFRNKDGTDATAANSRFKPTRNGMATSTDARAAIDELTLEACTRAKAKKVLIYTVGFSTPTDPIDAPGLSLLSQCATTASEHHFVANDSAALISAFEKIAKGIGKLRLTQ